MFAILPSVMGQPRLLAKKENLLIFLQSSPYQSSWRPACQPPKRTGHIEITMIFSSLKIETKTFSLQGDLQFHPRQAHVFASVSCSGIPRVRGPTQTLTSIQEPLSVRFVTVIHKASCHPSPWKAALQAKSSIKCPHFALFRVGTQI